MIGNGKEMSSPAERIAHARRINHLNQREVAEKIGVSSEMVSSWEKGTDAPEPTQYSKLGQTLHVSPEWLCTGKLAFPQIFETSRQLSERLFDEKGMYSYIRTYCAVKGLTQSERLLPYARRLHSGQFRKGNGEVPYIYHPLLVTCHALALTWDDDDLVSTCLLHDICEDCNISPEELPADNETKSSVQLLTKTPEIRRRGEKGMDEYLVKILDRCSNISTMAGAFPPDKVTSYIDETERWIYPLIEKAKDSYPDISNQIFLLRYHMYSVIETLKHLQY